MHGKTEGYYNISAASYGLQAGVFTRDIHKAHRAWDRLEVGGVIIGDVSGHGFGPALLMAATLRAAVGSSMIMTLELKAVARAMATA